MSFSISSPVSMKVRASSTIGAPNEGLEASSTGMVGGGANDLLIVGPDVLGRIVAEKWRKEHPRSQIYGHTRTGNDHEELIQMGISLKVPLRVIMRANEWTDFPYVLFCAPPSGSSDYLRELRKATLNWNNEGSFLFTSTSALYDCSDNGSCDEDTPIVPMGRSPSTDKILKAERTAIGAGGCVVRLAETYKADRGAHSDWLEKGTVDVRPDHILNLIHYEDAASLSIAILKKKNLRNTGSIFLGCDNHPLSRQEMMDLVNNSGKYSKKFESFTGTTDPLGQKLNNSKTRAKLGWEPRYSSFVQFLESL